MGKGMKVVPGYEVGLAYEGSATPQVYLLLQPVNRVALMSPGQARSAADLFRVRSRTADDPEELLSIAATLDELAADVESGVKRRRKRTGMSAEQWNAAHPVGTRVRYRPVLGRPEFVESSTRTEAWECSDEPVVAIVGFSGGKSLRHIEVIVG